MASLTGGPGQEGNDGLTHSESLSARPKQRFAPTQSSRPPTSQQPSVDVSELMEATREEMLVYEVEKPTAPLSKRFVPLNIRVLPEDKIYAQDIARKSGRSESFVYRMALHMFCEAHRANPKVIL